MKKDWIEEIIEREENTKQCDIHVVSKSVNCDKCDGWGYTIDDVGSKTCDCQKENSSN
tara:strand:+ start:234 stop:407 length:174 start_codon:yes stop_codon:yes gene_type:complete